jgi:uncharacterized phiE125 gp8 family phage protein
MIVVYSGPTTEPLSIAEVQTHLRLDASNQEPAPGVITAALAGTPTTGNVTAGAHRYLATFVTADGETQAGEVSSAVTVADAGVNGQVSLTAIPVGGALVTSRKIYRTAAGGSVYLLLATIANNTATTYTDNIADALRGAQAPTSNTTGDPQLSMLITMARQEAEQALRRSLVTQTLDMYLDGFPCVAIMLPPLQSVSAITYTDTAGVEQTLAADQYIVDTTSRPARITPAYAVSWPSTLDQINAVKIRFIAGYGAASAVPSCVKAWMLLRIAELHPSVKEPIPEYAHCLLDPERVTGRAS